MTLAPSVPDALAPSAPDALADRDVATRTGRAIGTTVVVGVTERARADRAMELVAGYLAELDAACSRFRPDSEVRRLERLSDGRPVAVGPLLFEVLEVACAVAVSTAGVVDPTVGSALVELGYDRDFAEVSAVTSHDRAQPAPSPEPAPGWWQIVLEPDASTASVPPGVHIDLGSTAKAFAADRAAAQVAAELGGGALVCLGGDVAVAGEAPPGGWTVGIAPDCRTAPGQVDALVTIRSGGLATSGTTARSWVRGGRRVHHIVDPWTGEPAPRVWSLVSVAAPSCVEANAWTTAAVVWGADAVGNLAAAGVPARLVDAGGTVRSLGDWPDAGEGPGPMPVVAGAER